jgi:phenylalanyl-tRNA synthetase alpha chain
VLRTHTSAHQCQFISSGESAFLCSGDVYRRDEIDATHYPIFHQMEGVRIFTEEELSGATSVADKKLVCSLPASLPLPASSYLPALQLIEQDLKRILTGLATSLFGNVEMRWREDYFPFTQPSFELEILYDGKLLEVLGCGVIHDQVLPLPQTAISRVVGHDQFGQIEQDGLGVWSRAGAPRHGSVLDP